MTGSFRTRVLIFTVSLATCFRKFLIFVSYSRKWSIFHLLYLLTSNEVIFEISLASKFAFFFTLSEYNVVSVVSNPIALVNKSFVSLSTFSEILSVFFNLTNLTYVQFLFSTFNGKCYIDTMYRGGKGVCGSQWTLIEYQFEYNTTH